MVVISLPAAVAFYVYLNIRNLRRMCKRITHGLFRKQLAASAVFSTISWSRRLLMTGTTRKLKWRGVFIIVAQYVFLV
jgi:hypothetical protein